MAVVTICSDFGAPKEDICHYFHLFLKKKINILKLIN